MPPSKELHTATPNIYQVTVLEQGRGCFLSYNLEG